MSTRANVRRKLVELLKDKTDAADRVFQNRARQLWPEELPAILVYSRSETAREFDTAPRSIERELQIAVEIVAAADEELDETLDALAEQVERRLMGDDTLGNLCSDIILTGTEMSISGEGETLFGSAILNFRVLYHTEIYVQDAEITDLERIDVEWDLKNDDNIDAVDTLDTT
jgi:hypothetical protein